MLHLHIHTIGTDRHDGIPGVRGDGREQEAREPSGWHAELEDLGFADPQGAMTRLECLL